MQTAAWALVVYVVLDRLATLAMAGRGRVIEITWSFAVVSFLTGGVIIWAIAASASC